MKCLVSSRHQPRYGLQNKRIRLSIINNAFQKRQYLYKLQVFLGVRLMRDVNCYIFFTQNPLITSLSLSVVSMDILSLLNEQKGIVFDYDFGYSLPFFSFLLKKEGKGELINKNQRSFLSADRPITLENAMKAC